MASAFSEILRVAVEDTPSAIGGAFAAGDGEMVDFFATIDPTDWALLTAHYGVVLAQVQAALQTCHYGEANLVMLEHADMDILVHAVQEGYYALLALSRPAPLAQAISAITRAVSELRREMG
jgi:predicted regulator of Ras-like GTPase activity (Roadblock/LC7/MglB family)